MILQTQVLVEKSHPVSGTICGCCGAVRIAVAQHSESQSAKFNRRQILPGAAQGVLERLEMGSMRAREQPLLISIFALDAPQDKVSLRER